MKDEDSDIDVPEDEGSESDMEECRPSKPRPVRHSFMAGMQRRDGQIFLYGLLIA